MKIKKILTISLALVLAMSTLLLGTACGASDDGKYTIGISQLIAHDALDAATKGFKDAVIAGLGEENVEFIEQNADGSTDACATIANTFVQKKVDLIMANATPALLAAYSATETIPILGTSITEYGVALGLKDFNGTVGSNVSGTSDLAPLDQQAQMIIDLVPEAKKVGLLYCSGEANSVYQVQVVEAALKAKNIEVTRYTFSDSNDVATVAANAASNSDALYIPTDNTAAACAETIYGAMTEKKPIITGESNLCAGCGIATLSIDYYDLGYATGEMAVKILKDGADITKMAIEYTPEEKLAKKYNKAICQELGIDIAALEAAGYTAID